MIGLLEVDQNFQIRTGPPIFILYQMSAGEGNLVLNPKKNLIDQSKQTISTTTTKIRFVFYSTIQNKIFQELF